MKIQLLPSEFIHVDDSSTYNHNHYQSKDGNMYIMVLEICNEDYDFFEYYLVDNCKEVFLGCSKNSLSNEKIVEVDFLYYYT